jgi:hypothetical protein
MSAGSHGHPASDVLATQSLLLPQDPGAPPVQQSQLNGLLASAASTVGAAATNDRTRPRLQDATP